MSEDVPIVFIRHGETDWNKRGLIQGSIDTDLNETGHAQARGIARSLIRERASFTSFDLVCSPQKRARQTMAHVVVALERESDTVSLESRLRELEFGIWESKPFWELKASPVYPAHPEDRYNWRPEGGESYEDGVARVREWRKHLKRPTIVVSHGAVGRCLLGEVAGLSPGELVQSKTPQGHWCYLYKGTIQWFDANSVQA